MLQGAGNQTKSKNKEVIKVWAFSDFKNQVKSYIENFKYLIHIEDDDGIGGKCTCV